MRSHKPLILAALGALSVQNVWAQQASNFDISPEVAEAHFCDAQCQGSIAFRSSLDLQILGTDFDFDFYETAANFSGSEPGDILKVVPINDPQNPSPEVAAYMIQFTSVGIDGAPVPATGFIALPSAKACSRFNLIAYAHGTTGLFRGCARSTYTNFFDYEGWMLAVLAGYAVVATDYSGLGNNYTEHMYGTKAQAYDVFYSVRAAQKAFPSQLSKDWVTVGHSQGGGAVWQLSEDELVQDSNSGYLGGVTIAPPTKLYDQFAATLEELRNNNTGGSSILGLVPSVIISLERFSPGYDAPLLTTEAKERIKLAEIGQLCLYAISGLVSDLPPTRVFLDLYNTEDAVMQEFQEKSSPAQGARASQPLLVIHGSADGLIPPASSKAAFDDSCGYGNLLHRTVYEGWEHTTVVKGSSEEWLQFADDRFEGRDFGSKCTESFIGAGTGA